MRKHALILALLAPLGLALPPAAHAGWTNDPYNGMVPVCTADGEQAHLRICRLAYDRTLVAWGDERDFPRLYFQILDAQGIPQLQTNGLPVVDGDWITAWGNIMSSLVSDNEGGGVAVFEDYRSGVRQIYGQRFDSLGNPLWGATGLPMAIWAGGQTGLKDVTTDSLGNGFIAWSKNLNPVNEIFVQKFDLATGGRLWGEGGIRDCGDNALCDYQQLVIDGRGGVYDAWADTRSGWEDWHLYAQHLDAAGNALWRPNGIPIRDPMGGNILPGDALTDGVPDGLGGGIWVYNPPIPYVSAFRLLPVGRVAWRVTCDIYFPIGIWAMLRHPQDGTVWISCEANWPSSADYYIFRLAPRTGAPYFGEAGLSWGGNTMAATGDGVITVRFEYGADRSRLKARRVTSAGALAWQAFPAALDGPIQGGGSAFADPECASDGADGIVCAWIDLRNYAQTGFDIYAQRVHYDGQLGSPTAPVQSQPEGQIANPPPAD